MRYTKRMHEKLKGSRWKVKKNDDEVEIDASI